MLVLPRRGGEVSGRMPDERLAEIRLDCADDGIGWESGRELLDEIDALRLELAEEHVAFEDLQECAEKLVDRAEAAEAALVTAREEAIEEAAKVAEAWRPTAQQIGAFTLAGPRAFIALAPSIAARIRALAGKPAERTDE